MSCPPGAAACHACELSQPQWARPELSSGSGERNLESLGWRVATGTKSLGFTDVVARGVGREPPACLAASASCASAACGCAAAQGYHAHAASGSLADPSLLKQLRVFLLDGHVGPMNDMVSLLVNVLGVSPASIDGMYFLQAHIMHSMLDKRILLRKPRGLLGKSVHYRELNRFLTLDPKAGAGPSAYLCDKRRCRQAVHDEGIRREFAARFGALFAAHVDVVACNFPSWQCLLFDYVNVSVVIRFSAPDRSATPPVA